MCRVLTVRHCDEQYDQLYDIAKQLQLVMHVVHPMAVDYDDQMPDQTHITGVFDIWSNQRSQSRVSIPRANTIESRKRRGEDANPMVLDVCSRSTDVI